MARPIRWPSQWAEVATPLAFLDAAVASASPYPLSE